jgi:hypothetical protein
MSEIFEQLTVTFDELFQAVSLLENHKFVNNEEYIQSEHIQIETEHGYDDIRGLIKKTAPLLKIILEDASIITCADKHILFDESGEKFAINFKIGDLVKTSRGYSPVIAIEKIAESADVFDIEVGNSQHTYITANGVVHHNTSITAAISYCYGEMGYRMITIVPSADLVDQTADWYRLLGMDVGIYSGTEKDITRTHTVATWQALQYNPSVMQEFQGLIWDECHGIKAAIAQKLINDHGKHIAFRFGVTGTFPKPETDKMSLHSSIGPILREIPASWLIENSYLSKVEIQPVELNETYVDEEFPDYASEKAFLSKSPARMEMIANLIISQCATHGNTLVLVNSIPFGEKLASLIKDAVFLYGESPSDLRKEHYDMFEQRDDIIVIASSGIASTGISIDRVFCLMLVDAGKSFIKAIQSIGRGLRRGRDKDAVHVVDVHSKQKWAKKHARDREKHYKEAGYPILKKQVLKVKG